MEKMTILYLDFETRGTVDLKSAGADRYAADPNTHVWCMAWALDDDPVSIWFPGDKPPHKALEHIESGGDVGGWNSGGFELPIWRHVIRRDYPDWPELRLEQIDDTMARAVAAGLPGGLDMCAQAVGIPLQKDMEGRRLMLKMCVPTLKWRKNPEGPPEWHDNAKDLQRLGEYCMRDVMVERELRRRIDPLSPRERAVWLMDRRINDRGVHVDTLSVEAALRLVDKEKRRLSAELREVTKGAVTNGNSVPQLLTFLKDQGLEMDNLKKRPVSRMLRSETPMTPEARRVLQIRQEMSKASTAKLKAMLRSRDVDGACRGLFSYHVATTGRWAGRRIQLQNLMRPDEEVFADQKAIEDCIELFGDEEHGEDMIRLCYDRPMAAVASCMRGLIVAKEGHEFIGGDFTGIENRVLMWLAGEDWMLEEFRKFDRGEGVDNYKLTYSRSFGVPLDQVTKKQRLIGKVGALACGFAGSVGAYMGMGDVYDVVPGDVARAAREAVSDYVWTETAKRYPKEEQWRFGLDVDTWTGIKIVVDAWRNAHPNVTQSWWDWQDCALNAVDYPGHVQISETTKLKFACDKKRNFLLVRLPSGRFVHYPRPSVEEVKFGTSSRTVVKYYGLDRITKKKWVQRTLTPQILSENVTSGTARDVLVDAMFRIEKAGYPIVLHVHDECVAQVPIGRADKEEFRHIMCDSAPWLDGLPVASKVESGRRFWK
jgi:DNA polymerase